VTAAASEAERVLIELLSLERELLELAYVRRTDAMERVGDAIRRLGGASVTEGILERAATELGNGSDFRRIVISEVDGGLLRPLTIWSADDQPAAERALAGLAGVRMALEYPLIEHDVVRGAGPRIVNVAAAGARTPGPLAAALGWSAYAVAAIAVAGESIGLLHADLGDRPTHPDRPTRPSEPAHPARELDALDAEVGGAYAEGLAGVLQRAVLRHTLDLHQAELRAAAQWMGARLESLTAAAAGVGGAARGGGAASGGDAGWQARLLDGLTPRELDVLRLLARGLTNRAIADALVVREGTVKYHVKNILRKLGATSRADAVSRFVRAGESGAKT
jgi:DNA-binding CsgD family transcriptional regulator